MLKSLRLALKVLIVAIVVGNLLSPFINLFVNGLFQTYHFETRNGEYQFETIPSNGRDLEMMKAQSEIFFKENPQVEDKTIYRTFKCNPLQFWNWYRYVFNEHYRYEYKSREESEG